MDELTDKEVAQAIAQIRSAVYRVEHGVEGARKEIKEVDGNVLQLIEGTFITSATHKYHLKPTSMRLADKERKAREDEAERSWLFSPTAIGR